MNPSGQQNCAGHSGALFTDWWQCICTVRCRYSGVSSERMVEVCLIDVKNHCGGSLRYWGAS